MCHDERESGQLSWEVFDMFFQLCETEKNLGGVYVVDNITHDSTPSAGRLHPAILAGLQK
jgi:hypothetical protein